MVGDYMGGDKGQPVWHIFKGRMFGHPETHRAGCLQFEGNMPDRSPRPTGTTPG